MQLLRSLPDGNREIRLTIYDANLIITGLEFASDEIRNQLKMDDDIIPQSERIDMSESLRQIELAKIFFGSII